jgi:hypothetical protein
MGNPNLLAYINIFQGTKTGKENSKNEAGKQRQKERDSRKKETMKSTEFADDKITKINGAQIRKLYKEKRVFITAKTACFLDEKIGSEINLGSGRKKCKNAV